MTLPKYRTSDYTIQPHPHGEYYLVVDVDAVLAPLVEALTHLAIELYAGANTLYREKAILKCDQDWLLEQAAKARAALAATKETHP